MSNDSFNASIIGAIKSIRKVKGIKQGQMASFLSMSECNYCKIEKQSKEITSRQLLIICEQLGISARMLISLAEEFQKVDFSSSTTESVFLSIYNNCNYRLVDDFKDQDLLKIISTFKTILLDRTFQRSLLPDFLDETFT